MEIEQFLYDLTESGEAIVAYTMTSASGTKVQLCNLGASVLSFTLPEEGADIVSGRCVLGLRGVKGLDKSRFDERLWESWVEGNRVIMEGVLSRDGVDVNMQVVFDFDDEELFEITYQAFSDADVEFDLTHALQFNLGGVVSCTLDGEGVLGVTDARPNILSEVTTLRGEVCEVEICTTQPSIYIDKESGLFAPLSIESVLNNGERYIQKSTYRLNPIVKP